MQFTPQQLSGGPRFGSKVKIGNWNEDRSRMEIEAKDYELKKTRGTLRISHQQKTRLVGTQPVPHSFSADGKVRFGDTVQLVIDEVDPKTGTTARTALANNIWELVNHAKGTVAASGATFGPAVARNTWVITRPGKTRSGGALGGTVRGGGGESKGDDDVVTYGDAVYLATNPSLRVDDRTGMVAAPYHLTSELASTLVGSGKGGIQEVVLSLAPGAGAEWRFAPADGDLLGSEGLPVPSGAPVQLVHCVTNQSLACRRSDAVINDFGSEVDVHCKTYKGTGLAGGGKPRPVQPVNRWSIVHSTDPKAAEDKRGFVPLTVDALIEKVREVINKRGAYGIRGLGRSFRIMDDRGDMKLDREDFKWGLYDYGVHLTNEEFDQVLDHFDRNNDGLISFDEFLVAVRGPIPESRKVWIREAYKRLDKDGSGLVTLSDLVTVYNTDFHPGVKSGEMTHEEAVSEFMSQWDTTKKDGTITPKEFEEYYLDVSASIDRDDYFELMMRNAWHISGGTGVTENTSNRRVLVKFADGHDEVVEIKDDLGLKADDIAGMKARLEAQGVSGIVAISTSY